MDNRIKSHRLLIHVLTLFATLIASMATTRAGSIEPITGAAFDSLLARQHADLQASLRELFPESEGYHVTGPLDPLMEDHLAGAETFRAPRVICPDLASLQAAIARAKSHSAVRRVREALTKPLREAPEGFRGALILWSDREIPVVLVTIAQTRWLIWAHDLMVGTHLAQDGKRTRPYARAVSDYLYAIDLGLPDPALKSAVEFGLPEAVDLYATDPPYVIEGYENYKSALHAHAAIRADFADGILAFLPTDSLREALVANAESCAYPNKEAPAFQEEMRKFQERGGDMRGIQTLTREGLDTLAAGEYFFAVGINGRIRFGRELLREEVERVERETGRKVPRANHAFLFPGEPVLTAGAFFVERNPAPRITLVNTHSGHYFYSNVSPTIREDIALRSDRYLLTIGHFFRALEAAGIPGDSIMVSKM